MGEIILRDLCSFLPKESLLVCEVSRFERAEPLYEGIRIESPDEKAWRPLGGRFGALLNHLRVITRFRKAADRLVSTIVEFARLHQVDRIWLTLSSQTLIRLAGPLAHESGIPIFSLVWDPPDFLARRQAWDSASVAWTLRNFDQAMKASAGVMVVSDAMADQYTGRYGIPCTVVRHAFDCQERTAANSNQSESPLRIGFAGSLYDQDQFNCLIAALNALNWRVRERQVTLRMVGNYYRFTKLSAPCSIELFGWQSTGETLRLLSECDFTYLPISFKPEFREFARLAFPTKLSTFLATWRPVLVHAPDYAAPAILCQQQSFGIVCSSMDARDLEQAILEITVRERQDILSPNTQRICRNLFSREVMKESFAKFLGLRPELLSN